jgi:hypothetical protein
MHMQEPRERAPIGQFCEASGSSVLAPAPAQIGGYLKSSLSTPHLTRTSAA